MAIAPADRHRPGLGVLLAPRRPDPEGIPLPIADPRGMANAIDADRSPCRGQSLEQVPSRRGPRMTRPSVTFHALEAGRGIGLFCTMGGGTTRRWMSRLVDAMALGKRATRRLRVPSSLENILAEAQRFLGDPRAVRPSSRRRLEASFDRHERRLALRTRSRGGPGRKLSVLFRRDVERSSLVSIGRDERSPSPMATSAGASRSTRSDCRTAFYLSQSRTRRGRVAVTCHRLGTKRRDGREVLPGAPRHRAGGHRLLVPRPHRSYRRPRPAGLPITPAASRAPTGRVLRPRPPKPQSGWDD